MAEPSWQEDAQKAEKYCLRNKEYITERLRKNSQFNRVYSKGKSSANHLLVLYVLKNGEEVTRLGVSVSKKVGKSVVRSRKTRQIKECVRLISDTLKQDYDIVFIARPPAKDASYSELDASVSKLLKRMNVVN